MTGLPWKVRYKLEGIVEETPSEEVISPARLGNYTYTYGLTKEDEAALRGEIPNTHSVQPQPKDRSFYTRNLPKTWMHDQDDELDADIAAASAMITNGHVAETEDSDALDTEDKFYKDYLTAHEDMTDESKMLLRTTRNILHKTGLMPSSIDDDMISYFQDLERMEHKGEDKYDFTTDEKEEALKAFRAPVVKQSSRIQPKTYYEVRRNLESTREMINNKKRVRVVTASSEKIGPEPPVRSFTPAFTLPLESRVKVIEKHLKEEEEKSHMSRVEYDKRKRELMEAALQVIRE